MNKKYMLALLSGTLLLANSTFGKNKEKKEANLEAMQTPNEVSANSSRKGENPFPKQDKDFVKVFNSENVEKVFFANTEKDPFMEIDPWDD